MAGIEKQLDAVTAQVSQEGLTWASKEHFVKDVLAIYALERKREDRRVARKVRERLAKQAVDEQVVEKRLAAQRREELRARIERLRDRIDDEADPVRKADLQSRLTLEVLRRANSVGLGRFTPAGEGR